MSGQQVSRQELIWITLLSLGYFLILLGSRLLNVPDEGRYSEIAREMLLTGDFITPKLNGVAFFHKPVLHYWLQSLSFIVLGINEWAARLMPALSGVLGCVMTYVAGTLLYSRQTGRLAALILATNPLFYLSTHYADMNLQVAVFISCALLCFVIAVRYPVGRTRRNILWLAYAFAGLAVLTKGMIGIVFPVMVTGAWILFTRRWRLLREIYLTSGLFIFLIIVLPWFVAVHVQNPGFFDYFVIYQHFTRFTGTGFNNAFQFWFYLPVLLVGFFPWSLVFIIGARDNLRRILTRNDNLHTDLFLWLWVVLITVFFSLPESKIVGYILPVVPAMALLSAAYLARQLEANNVSKGLLTSLSAVAITSILFVLALLAVPELDVRHNTLIAEYIHYVQVVLMIGGIAIIIFSLLKKLRYGVIAVILTGVFLPIALLLLISPVSTIDSVKPLTDQAKLHIKPGDLIASYEDFYYDLGIYLQWPDRIIVVTDWDDKDIAKQDNWRSEFYHGFPDTQGEEDWMLDKASFKQRIASLQSTQDIYVFSRESLESVLVKEFALHVIASANGISLLTSKTIDKAGQ